MDGGNTLSGENMGDADGVYVVHTDPHYLQERGAGMSASGQDDTHMGAQMHGMTPGYFQMPVAGAVPWGAPGGMPGGMAIGAPMPAETAVPEPIAAAPVPSVSESEGASNYINRDWKTEVTFVPSELGKKGMKGVFRVPLRKLINATWRTHPLFPWSDRSKVGKITISGLDTDFFDSISGRLWIPDPRMNSGGLIGDSIHHGDEALAKALASDRLGADVFIKGANHEIQFSLFPGNKSLTDTSLCVREQPTTTSTSFLDSIGQGMMTEDELWEEVKEDPSGVKGSRIASVTSAVGQFAQRVWGGQLRFQDKANTQIKLHVKDAKTLIDRMMSEQFDSLTLGEMYNNGYFEFYRTNVDPDGLESTVEGTARKMMSPWTVLPPRIENIKNSTVRKAEREKMLNQPYRINATISAEILPVKPDL